MDQVLTKCVKGFLFTGLTSMCVGTLGILLSPSEEQNCVYLSDRTTYLEMGPVTHLFVGVLQRLYALCSYYPETLQRYDKICSYLQNLSLQYSTSIKNYQVVKKLLKIQRRIFEELSELELDLSETIAVDEMFRISDELKNTVTDLCLLVDS